MISSLLKSRFAFKNFIIGIQTKFELKFQDEHLCPHKAISGHYVFIWLFIMHYHHCFTLRDSVVYNSIT